MQTEEQTWKTPPGAVEFEWSFSSVQSLVKMTRTFYAGINHSLDVSCVGKGMTLGKASVCS